MRVSTTALALAAVISASALVSRELLPRQGLYFGIGTPPEPSRPQPEHKPVPDHRPAPKPEPKPYPKPEPRPEPRLNPDHRPTPSTPLTPPTPLTPLIPQPEPRPIHPEPRPIHPEPRPIQPEPRPIHPEPRPAPVPVPVPALPPTCPAGYGYQDGQCVPSVAPILTCPSGYQLANGACYLDSQGYPRPVPAPGGACDECGKPMPRPRCPVFLKQNCATSSTQWGPYDENADICQVRPESVTFCCPPGLEITFLESSYMPNLQGALLAVPQKWAEGKMEGAAAMGTM